MTEQNNIPLAKSWPGIFAVAILAWGVLLTPLHFMGLVAIPFDWIWKPPVIFFALVFFFSALQVVIRNGVRDGVVQGFFTWAALSAQANAGQKATIFDVEEPRGPLN